MVSEYLAREDVKQSITDIDAGKPVTFKEIRDYLVKNKGWDCDEADYRKIAKIVFALIQSGKFRPYIVCEEFGVGTEDFVETGLPKRSDTFRY